MYDQSILDYARSQTSLEMGNRTGPAGVGVIGSFAYPEFSRPDSDLDLIIFYDAHESPSSTLVLHTDEICGGRRIIETRIFSRDLLMRYVLSCNLPRLYAFVRGYRVICDSSDGYLERCFLLGIARYFTDAFELYRNMREVDFAKEIETFRFMISDACNSIVGERIQSQPTLRMIRTSEVIRDFLSSIWLLETICQAQRLPEILDVDPHNDLLSAIGLLRVFQEARGGRIIDHYKYDKPELVAEAVQQLDLLDTHDIGAIFATMHRIFLKRFSVPLLLGNTSYNRIALSCSA